ncbi:MAG: pancreas/duodenum homeobox protein 1, partial [Desulfobulbaceae bacterium]|nr:pancreas/duodenum homeobox protein 1 [Desulfobulbaceae bacterium]
MASNLNEIFNQETLTTLFPPARSNDFFEALFGDASEGAYDIVLTYAGSPDGHTYHFELHLKQRPGQCLACNLTYGLPEVFSRHPIINIKGLVAAIAEKINVNPEKITWQLKATKSISKELHIIPL